MKKQLLEIIENVSARKRWRFHFPGHAGQPLTDSSTFPSTLFQNDLTELPELDVLGSPIGVLAELQAHIAQAYGVTHSFCLINGASVGLMAAMLALPQNKRKVIVPRNAHRSVVQGLILSGHEPVWVLPEEHPDWGIWGAVAPETIQDAIDAHPNNIAGVILTHPTYEGIVSDIQSIARITKAAGIPLIVDEAHGALWPLFDALPESAISVGADIVVHSLHKSAGALTQCALLHVNHNSLLAPTQLQQALNTLQTTSPSYPLLLSIEETVSFWASEAGQQKLQGHLALTQDLRDWITAHCKAISALTMASGSLQLLLKHADCSSETLATELEETHNIAFESVNEQSVLLHLNPNLPAAAFLELKQALRLLDKSTSVSNANTARSDCFSTQFTLPEVILSPRDAFLSTGKMLDRQEAIGNVSRQLVATCPPGIPILMPGERISEGHMAFLPASIDVVTPHDALLDNSPCFAYSGSTD